MEANEIVPDVIDEVPPNVVNVIYPEKKAVNLGNELAPSEVKEQPTVSWDSDPNSYYTLAMVDPDAPSRAEPQFREFNHWLVCNIKGSDVSKGDVVTAYTGSGPPKGTGLHRYVFLVYRQPNKIDVDEPRTGPTSRAHRRSFSVRKFAQKYQLGKPIAGNFYLAQWDPYVEERKKFMTD